MATVNHLSSISSSALTRGRRRRQQQRRQLLSAGYVHYDNSFLPTTVVFARNHAVTKAKLLAAALHTVH